MSFRDPSPQSELMRFAWPVALAFAAVAGTLITACMMPFVGLAVVAAATMPVSRAVRTVGAVWLVNQMLGYGLLHYPWTAFSVSWGVAMLLASVAAVFVARLVLRPEGPLRLARVAAAFVLGFVTYEGLLYGFTLFAGGRETFTAAIVLRLAANDAAWMAGLLAFRLLLARAAPGWFGPRPALRVA